jgi:hypothetical protein
MYLISTYILLIHLIFIFFFLKFCVDKKFRLFTVTQSSVSYEVLSYYVVFNILLKTVLESDNFLAKTIENVPIFYFTFFPVLFSLVLVYLFNVTIRTLQNKV